MTKHFFRFNLNVWYVFVSDVVCCYVPLTWSCNGKCRLTKAIFSQLNYTVLSYCIFLVKSQLATILVKMFLFILISDFVVSSMLVKLKYTYFVNLSDFVCLSVCLLSPEGLNLVNCFFQDTIKYFLLFIFSCICVTPTVIRIALSAWVV